MTCTTIITVTAFESNVWISSNQSSTRLGNRPWRNASGPAAPSSPYNTKPEMQVSANMIRNAKTIAPPAGL